MEKGHLDRSVVKQVLPAVVQIVALARGRRGNYQPVWTGSGTVIHPQGVILTNCHVVDPRAMGMPAPRAEVLGIAITERSDESPALSYIAETVAKSPKMDLAVLRITMDVNGRRVSGLKLPWVAIGDSDELELGDIVSIFGYPGIGGETVTFTSGSVSGFTRQKDVTPGRAWIKTDATIAGGNSGGTAVDHHGHLVGIPTQAAAGTGISPVDARPVVDTNQDGRIDERDTPMAVGGFINGLRPVNMALPLLKKAGIQVQSVPKPAAQAKPKPAAGTLPSIKKPKKKKEKSKEPKFSDLVFSEKVTNDGRPINPSSQLSGGHSQIFAGYNFEGMKDGLPWRVVWALNGEKILQEDETWSDGPAGRKVLSLAKKGALPEGEYHLVLALGSQITLEGEVTVGSPPDDSDTEISGQVIDRVSKKGVVGALVIALKPGVSTADFVKKQEREMTFTSTKTDKLGRFTFAKQLPKGQSYGLVVVARGYRDMTVDSALRVSASAPEKVQIYPVPMIPE